MQQQKTPRRVSLGQGWETATTNKEPEALAVRIRSGTHLATGKMIGETKQPRAFVWIDEAANDPKREVVICPDLKNTWLWENGQAASLDAAFPGNKEVQRLTKKFAYWMQFLEEHWSPDRSQRFFWGRFHDEGVWLARKLQALVVEEAVVRYWRPAQDPRSNIEREIAL